MAATQPDHVPPRCVVAGLPYWHATKEHPCKPLPTRDERTQEFRFHDYPGFRPNLSPAEVLRAGAFGGAYFRTIHSRAAKRRFEEGVHLEFPPSWFEGIDDVGRSIFSADYRKEVNRYKVKSGNDLDFWENKGWMRSQDPYGWFQWYCRFYLGRRTEDDERQVSRWVKAIGPKGRWRTYLVGQCVRQGKAWDDATASPVKRQTLLHWGYQLSKAEFDRLAGPIRNGKSVIYMGPVVAASGDQKKKNDSTNSKKKAGASTTSRKPRTTSTEGTRRSKRHKKTP